MLKSLLIFLPYVSVITAKPSLQYPINCQPIGPYPYASGVSPSFNDRFMIVNVPAHISANENRCEDVQLSLSGLLLIEALLYAKDTFGVRKRGSNSTAALGMLFLDNCDVADKTVQDLVNFESCTLFFEPVFPDQAVFYFVAADDDARETRFSSSTPANFHTSTEPRTLHKPILELTVNEEIAEQMIRALASLLRNLSYKNVVLLYDDERRLILFRNSTHKFRICSSDYQIPEAADEKIVENTLKFVHENNSDSQILVLLTASRTTAKIITALQKLKLQGRWQVVGFCASLKYVEDDRLIPPGSLMLARENDLTDFYEYLSAEKDVLGPWAAARNPWLNEFFRREKCQNSQTCSASLMRNLDENRWLKFNDRITEAILIYDAATTTFEEEFYATPASSKKLKNSPAIDVLKIQKKIESMRRDSTSSVMILNYRQTTNKGWRFVRIGTVRDGIDVRLPNGSVQTFLSTYFNTSVCPKTCIFCYERQEIYNESTIFELGSRHKIQTSTNNFLLHRTDLWAQLLSSLTAAMVFLILIYEIYAVTKICYNLPRASAATQSAIFLSQILLYGVMFACVSIFSVTLTPNFFVCILLRLAPGLSIVWCYATLFAKLLVLISARQGQYLAGFYQALVVVLFLAIQTIVNIQGLFSKTITVSENVSVSFGSKKNDTFFLLDTVADPDTCELTFSDYLKIMVLPFFLIASCSIMGFITRKNPYNYNETAAVALTAMSNGLVWIVCLTLGLLIHETVLRDAVFGYGLLTNSFLMTSIMFFSASQRKTVTGEGIGFKPEFQNVVSGLKRPNYVFEKPITPTWFKYFYESTPAVVSTRGIIAKSPLKNGERRNGKPQILRTDLAQKISTNVSNFDRSPIQNFCNLDPGGSAVTLDVPSAPRPRLSILSEVAWKTTLGRSKRGNYNLRSSSGLFRNTIKPIKEEDFMLYAPAEERKPSTAPTPIFPSVLTPALLLGGPISPQRTDARQDNYGVDFLRHLHYARPKVWTSKPFVPSPSHSLYRSRSSTEFYPRKYSKPFLHHIAYRSKSVLDLAKWDDVSDFPRQK